jgi:hypothetical protein
MKFLILSLLAGTLLAGEWEAVQRIPADHKIEVTTTDGTRTHATFVRASSDAISVRADSGELSIARSDVRQIRTADPARRVHRGVIWTGVGIAAGAGIGTAICPHCLTSNEGAPTYRYVGPGIGIGAAVGALGFLSSPYRVIYRSR